MNIFVVHRNPVIAAQSLCDKHVVKMPLETAQILSTVLHKLGHEAPYRATHQQHPCIIWAGATRSDYQWLLEHGVALCDEYAARYGKTHASKVCIDECTQHADLVPEGELLSFAQVMPDQYKGDDAVEAYRRYYIGDKARFATWKSPAKTPEWWINA
jgi:hypothetical protein